MRILPRLSRNLPPPPAWAPVFAALLPLCAAAGTLWLMADLPTPRCAFHLITNLPCATCGMTRAASALLEGDPARSFALNPLFLPLAATAILWWGYCVLVTARILSVPSPGSTSPRAALALRVGIALAVLATWLYLLLAPAASRFAQ